MSKYQLVCSEGLIHIPQYSMSYKQLDKPNPVDDVIMRRCDRVVHHERGLKQGLEVNCLLCLANE